MYTRTSFKEYVEAQIRSQSLLSTEERSNALRWATKRRIAGLPGNTTTRKHLAKDLAAMREWLEHSDIDLSPLRELEMVVAKLMKLDPEPSLSLAWYRYRERFGLRKWELWSPQDHGIYAPPEEVADSDIYYVEVLLGAHDGGYVTIGISVCLLDGEIVFSTLVVSEGPWELTDNQHSDREKSAHRVLVDAWKSVDRAQPNLLTSYESVFSLDGNQHLDAQRNRGSLSVRLRDGALRLEIDAPVDAIWRHDETDRVRHDVWLDQLAEIAARELPYEPSEDEIEAGDVQQVLGISYSVESSFYNRFTVLLSDWDDEYLDADRLRNAQRTVEQFIEFLAAEGLFLTLDGYERAVLALKFEGEPLSQVGGGHSLYRMYNQRGQLLYVGRTANFFSRVVGHANDKPWFREVDYVTLEHFKTVWDLEEAERHTIRDENPMHNKQRPAPKSKVRPKGLLRVNGSAGMAGAAS